MLRRLSLPPVSATFRFTVAPALVMLVLVAVLYAVTSWLVAGQLRKQSEVRVAQRSALLAERLAAALEANVQALQQLARHPALRQPGRPDAIRAELEWLAAAHPAYAWIGLVAPDGTVVSATKGWLEGASVASRPVFLEARQRLYFGDFHPTVALAPLMAREGLKGNVADVGVPVRDADGRLVAVLAAHLGEKWVRDLALATISPQERDELGMRGFALVGTPPKPLPESLPLHPLPELPEASGLVRHGLDDGRTFLVSRRELSPLEQAGLHPAWSVLITKEEEVAYLAARRLKLNLGIFAIASVLVFSALGYLAARRLTRPLDRLLAGARARFQARGTAAGFSSDEYLDALADELPAYRPQHGDTEDALLMVRLATGAQQLRRVIDHLPFGVALCGSDFRVEFLNQAYTRLLGWTTAQVRGQPAESFLFDEGEAREQFMAQLRELGTPPREFVARFEARCADGSRRLIQWQLLPLLAGPDEFNGVIAIVTDVSAEVRARREADALAKRLLLLADASADHAIVYLDDGHRIIGWNRGAQQLSRRSAAQALGTPFESLFREEPGRPGPGPGSPSALLALALRDGQVPIEAWMKRGEHARFFARGTLYRLPRSGDEAGFAAIFSDTTQAREALERVAQSEARLAAIITTASDAIVSTDVEGRVMRFNPAAERIFGLPARDMLGHGLERLLPPAARTGHALELSKFAQSRITRRPMGVGKVEGVRANGERIALEASIAQATVAGRTELTAILRDVTERVEAERALVQYQVELAGLTQRLLAQEKDTTQRLAQALHDDLGQTLGALRLIYDAGMRKLARQHEPEAWLQRLDGLLSQANRQIRQVLTELRPPLLDEQGLRPALDNELQQHAEVQDGPAFRLEWQVLPPGLRWPADIEYAAFMIAREACSNVLRHARARHAVVRVRGDTAQLVLEVEDDGPGAAGLERIVRPGHLGLVGMRERALAIGAALDISSVPGRGTLVTLSWGARHGQAVSD